RARRASPAFPSTTLFRSTRGSPGHEGTGQAVQLGPFQQLERRPQMVEAGGQVVAIQRPQRFLSPAEPGQYVQVALTGLRVPLLVHRQLQQLDLPGQPVGQEAVRTEPSWRRAHRPLLPPAGSGPRRPETTTMPRAPPWGPPGTASENRRY